MAVRRPAGGRARGPDGSSGGRGLPGLGDPALRAGQPRRPTMGRRLRLLWQLAGPGAGRRAGGPDIVVAPVKAVLQRLGPWRTAARPVVVAKGDRVVVEELVADLVGHGLPARVDGRAPGRAGRPRRHRRRLPFDGRRAGPHRPVGRRGGPADPVRRRRPALHRRPRPGRAVRLPRARGRRGHAGPGGALVGSAPWGRHQWDRLADGEQFDGMESWLPWLVEAEELLCDLLGDDALVVLVEPRRVRDRAPTCSTRSRPWPTPWPTRGASTPARTPPACTSPSTGC